MHAIEVSHNRLSGSIPDLFASWAPVMLEMRQNQLSGKFPHAFVTQKLQTMDISVNRLSGTLPSLLLTSWVFIADRNKLSGPLPSWLPACQECGEYVYILALNKNKFTGSVATWKHVKHLFLSNNLLEGALPSHAPCPFLSILDLSGEGGRSRGLSGTLPPALCRASLLSISQLQISRWKLLSRLSPPLSRLLLFIGTASTSFPTFVLWKIHGSHLSLSMITYYHVRFRGVAMPL